MESKKTKELESYEILIADKYALNSIRKLGSGSTGDVYSGRELDTEKLIAIKLEYTYHVPSLVKNEYKIYKKLQGLERIPKIHFFGEQGEFFVLIMDLLGPSIKAQMNFIKKSFSLATTLKISIQLLDIIENIHKKGVLLRYIKPENMVIGRGDNEDFVYLIDFGLAKIYFKNGVHSQYKEGKDRLGNIHFISINVHRGIKISRRDDIESLGYNLVYFMKGKLPWSSCLHGKEAKKIKIETSLEELCEGLPEEFQKFIEHARNLEFYEEPNYNYLKSLLLQTAEKNKIDINNVKYDWVIYKENLQKEQCEENGEKQNISKEINKDEIKDKESENKKIEYDGEGKISENVGNEKDKRNENAEKERDKNYDTTETEKNKISEKDVKLETKN